MFSVTETSMQHSYPARRHLQKGFLAAAAIAFGALSFAAATPASAQGYGYDYDYDEPYGYGQKWWKPYNKKPKPQKARANKPPAATSPAAKAEKGEKTTVAVSEKPVDGPLVLVVSLKHQRVTVYDRSGVIAVSPISSGRVGNPTPMGVYSILEKQKMHYSNLYDSAPMPNMQRITWSGVAMHAGVLPGYPASHGCIRLPHGFSQRLYNITKTGARVVVTRDDAPVQSFTHQALFTTTAFGLEPKSASVTPLSANGQVADASGRTVAAQTHVSDVAASVPGQALAAVEPAKVSPYRQKWLSEMEHRSEALKSAQNNKATATAKITATAQAADTAKADVKTARVAADQAAIAVKNAEAARLAAEKELDAFAKPLLSEKPMTDEQVFQSATREEALDAKLGELTASIASLTADADKATERLKAAEQTADNTETERKTALNALPAVNVEIKTAQDLVDEAKRREAKRQLPVTIFISRQTKKLYVRQGYAPILETPVEISEPDKLIGTHVFTALSVEPNSKDMTWSVVTVPSAPPAEAKAVEKSSKKNAVKEIPKPAVQDHSNQTPAAALERITIPAEAREQIADVMKPGSSLMISDYKVNNETGLFTDFIIGLR